MSADLEAVAARLGKGWGVSRKGTCLYQSHTSRCCLLIGRSGDRWWAGAVPSTCQWAEVKPPPPVWSRPITYATPEEAILGAEQAVERWEGLKRYEKALDVEWAAKVAEQAAREKEPRVFTVILDASNPFDEYDEVFK